MPGVERGESKGRFGGSSPATKKKRKPPAVPRTYGRGLAAPGHALDMPSSPTDGRDATIWAAKHSPSVAIHLLATPPPKKGPKPFVPPKAPTKKTQYDWAMQAQVNATAARKLAKTITPQERKEIFHPERLPAPLSHPSLASRALKGVEHLAAKPVNSLLEAAWGAGAPSHGPVSLPPAAAGALAGGYAASAGAGYAAGYGTLGPDLTKYLTGKPYDKGGLKMDVAMLPLLAAGKPFRAARVAAQLGKLAAEGEHSLPVLRSLAQELYHGPSLRQTRAATRAIKGAQDHDDAVIEAAIKSGRLSAPHERALREYAATEREVEEAAAKVADTKKGTVARKEAEKELDQAKGRRATAKGTETYERAWAMMKSEPLPITDSRQVARERVAKQLLRDLKTSKNALPPGATRKQIGHLFRFLDTMADAGVWGRHWYEDSAKAIKDMFPGDPDKAEKFAQLLAIYSPQQPIIGNTSLAIRASNEWNAAETALREAEVVKGESNGAITTGQQWQRDAAQKVLQGKGDWDGRKTNNFYVNFLEDINPAKFRRMVEDGDIRPDGVTIDMWMARVFGYTSDDVTAKGRYDFMEAIVRQLTEERGDDWKPKQVQAAIWTAIKGISDDVTQNIDFSTGIERHFGQFNFESAPGTEFLDDFSTIYKHWPAEVQQIFQRMNARLVDDFVRDVGLMAERGVPGPGIYAPDRSYRGAHVPPRAGDDVGASLDNLAGVYPEDIYSPDAARLYGHGGDAAQRQMDADTARIIQGYRGRPDAEVEVFRALPEDAPGVIHPGDWVTPNRAYAEQHAAGAPEGETYKIVSKRVPAGEVHTQGDSIHEFGWDPGTPDLEQNPATAVRFLTSAAPRAAGGKVAYRLFEPERVQVEKVAAAIGNALKQDSVAWIRPFVATAKGHTDTMHLKLGRVGTGEEAKALWKALNGEGERFAIINAHDGFFVKKIDESLKNLGSKKSPGARELAVKAADDVFKDTEVTVTNFASDGDLVPSSDYARHLGEGSNAGGPGRDVRFAAAADRLAREAADLRARFADASEHFADASGQVNPAAVRRELDRLQGLPWERVAVNDDLAATERWMEGIRHSLVDEGGNPVMSARFASGAQPADPDWEKYISMSNIDTPMDEAQWAEFDRLHEKFRDTPTPTGAMPSSVTALPGPEEIHLGRTKGSRKLRVNDLTVDMPHARATNPVTRAIPHGIENTADWFSKQIDKTLLKKHPNVWVVGTSGAESRAIKQAGRVKINEPRRREAEFGREIRTLIQHKEGSLTDLSHYWYAQLPADYRNAEGLTLVRDAQQRFLDDIQSGKKLKDLQAEKQAAKDEMKELEESGEQGSAPWYDAMGRSLMLDEVMGDLSSQQRNLIGSTQVLDKLIAFAPPADEEILTAMRTLMNDREQTLSAAGRLEEEKIDERPGLLARTLGLEPDGSEVYMGHRLGKDPNSGYSRFLPSIGTGRVKSPPGMGQNQMILWSTGRLRTSMRIALEDWQHASVFSQTNGMRDDIWRAAEPFHSSKREGYLKGKTIVNIKGRVIPAHWRTDELSQFGEGWDEIKDVRLWADEMVSGWAIQEPAAQKEMLAALKRGEVRHQDLRVIDNKKLERYAKQFRSAQGRSAPGAVGDMLVDMVSASIVTFRIGFVPKNIIQNAITMIPHQGVFAMRNMVRAAQVWHDPELRDFFLAEAGGQGAISALGKEASKLRKTGTGIRWATGKMTELADDPFRFAALLHELAAEGIISRGAGLLSEHDKASLLTFYKSKSETNKALKHQVYMRANNALPDFSRLTPDQSRILRRVAIIPGWLMAGSRWPFHFAATHPIRSMLIAYIAMGEPEAPDELRFNEPVTHYFHGRRYLRGIDTPWGRERVASLDPVSTPWELALAAKGSIMGRKTPFDYETDTLWSKVAPGVATIADLLQGDLTPRSALNRLLPAEPLIENLISPPDEEDTKSYPGDTTRLGRLRREVGILPIPVDDKAAGKKKSHRRRSGGLSGSLGGGLGGSLSP